MTNSETNAPKVKKSVALSGTPAGNTALCTVGRSGNDLHYRGYDIKDLATRSSFEEVAHLLVHGSLPTASQLKYYRTKLKRLRGLPAVVTDALELSPANAHPMDVLRTGCSVLGTVLPERENHPASEARDIADRLMASFGSMLLYWWHFTRNSRRIDVETNDETIAGHFLHLLHGHPPTELEADLRQRAGVLETKPLVQRDAAGVRRVDAADHGVHVVPARGRDQFPHHHAAQSLSPMILVHIHRMLDGVLVGRPGAEAAVGCKAHQLARVRLQPDDRKATGALGLEPARHLRAGARLVVIQGRRMHDGLVEDGEDGLAVSRVGAVNPLHALIIGRRRAAEQRTASKVWASCLHALSA